MKIHYDLSNIKTYINRQSHFELNDFVSQFEKNLKRIKKFKEIDSKTKILEVGTGTGWFPILCRKYGIDCEGLEICPQFVEYAKQFGRKHGIEPNIKLGNIEEVDIGKSTYDIIITLSTFEHVERWQKGLMNIYDALKPSGLLYFYSTNKFCLWSGECHIPFYGWLPDRWRYRLRTFSQGEDIMKLGIDFNQFTYPQLQRFFKHIGFSEVMDVFDVIGTDDLIYPTFWKKMLLHVMKQLVILKPLALFLLPGTLFVCKK